MSKKLKLELTYREAEALFTAVCTYQDRILRLPPEDRDDELNGDFDVMVFLSDTLDTFLFEKDVEDGFNDMMAGIKSMLEQKQ